MTNLNYFRNHFPTPVEGITEAVLGLTFYLSLFHGLINFLHYKSLPTTGNWRLNNYDILEISNKLVSSTFAVITCSLAIKGNLGILCPAMTCMNCIFLSQVVKCSQTKGQSTLAMFIISL